jgi:TATA-binding protein-associated factor Taf7
MVTVTPHLHNAVGVLLVTDDSSRGIFRPILEKETAVPARRTVIFATPKEGGDVLIKICEGIRDIKVTKPEPKSNGKAKKAEDDEDEDSEEDSDEEEEEEIREKTWKVGTVLGEAAVKGVKKGGKIEVTLNVSGELGVQVTAREVGGKGGVRGVI